MLITYLVKCNNLVTKLIEISINFRRQKQIFKDYLLYSRNSHNKS